MSHKPNLTFQGMYVLKIGFCGCNIYCLQSYDSAVVKTLNAVIKAELLYPATFSLQLTYPNPTKTRNPPPAHN